MSATATRQLTKAVRKGRQGVAHNKGPGFGRQIFVFNHVQTNQVVYSLTQNLNNTHALGQLPYNGKKTVPAALRKDLWEPFATIEFPPSSLESADLGLTTFRKLREYRKLHETQWPENVAVEESKDEEKKGEMVTLTKKARGRLLRDQKANSVADMAAALRSTTMKKAEQELAREKQNKSSTLWEPIVKDNVTVRWADILDAEFAESWPDTVVHDKWLVGRMSRKVPEKKFKFIKVKEPAPIEDVKIQ